ncbi:MAG: PD-(D/E)XK nuclease-like domain-containing protein [Pseudobdellovibrionaceae bacterium]|nr:PD-(D/E)XK nuclease-like domain-containing protein [Pseudobdellovibrionaceae bacterium]
MELLEGEYTRSELPIEAYHEDRLAASKTGLCLFDEAPVAYKHAYLDGSRSSDTTSLRLGRAVHAVLDGSFEESFAVGPDVKSRAEKRWKDFEAQEVGRICLKLSEKKKVLDMASALRAYPGFAEYVRNGDFEKTYVWRDPETGLLCKCRPDFITDDRMIVVDFKTARHAARNPFRMAAWNHKYFVSAAFTLEGVHASTGIMPHRYLFFVVQSSSPHLVAGYEATAEELALGREFLRRSLPRFKECREAGVWPGLPEEIIPLGLPGWVRSGEDHETTANTYSDDQWWE